MIRQNIILGNYTYIVDLYKANSDLKNSKHYEEFVILKTNDMLNNVIYDKDVFFIKKSIFEKCMNEDESINVELLGEMIAFPITNNSITMSYSANYQAFNGSYMPETFNMSDFSDILRIYSNSITDDSMILCDKIRIWLPITNSKLTSIIHISNIVNDVRFHYICENLGIYERDSNGEIKVGNDIYAEHIDIWIPNIENLFTPSKHYVKENYNFTKFKQKLTYKDSEDEYVTIYPCIYFDTEIENNNEIIKKKLSIEAFRTYEFNENYSLYLYKIVNSPIIQVTKLNWNMMSISFDTYIEDGDKFKLLLVDDTKIDYGQLGNNNALIPEEAVINKYEIYESEIIYKNDSLYCSTFLMVLPFFIDEQEMFQNSYACKTYFNVEKNLLDNILANPIVMSLYPFSSINPTTKSYEAAESAENSDIFTLSKDIKMSINFEFNKDNSEEDLEHYGAYMLNCKFHYHPLNNENLQTFYLDKVKLSHYDYLSDEIIDNGEYDDDIFNPKIKKCGFVIEMAADTTFKTLIYEYVMNMDLVDKNSTIIEDTKFKLDFDIKEIMWNAYPETLLIRVKYVDKISYTIIASNPLFITKENFKYIINNSNNRLMLIDAKQRNAQLSRQKYDELFNSLNEQHQANNEALEDMNISYFNFIDKVNCTIISKENNTTNSVTNGKTNQRVIYRPIFYKVKDLQQIKLKNGITQNIGLNLSDIISKADTFKVVIENIEFPEVARNDAYVIFKINSQDLKATSGQYNLLDQDDQFVSDGTWYIY